MYKLIFFEKKRLSLKQINEGFSILSKLEETIKALEKLSEPPVCLCFFFCFFFKIEETNKLFFEKKRKRNNTSIDL